MIPEHFEFNTRGGNIFVTRNAAEHMWEWLASKGTAGQGKLANGAVFVFQTQTPIQAGLLPIKLINAWIKYH